MKSQHTCLVLSLISILTTCAMAIAYECCRPALQQVSLRRRVREGACKSDEECSNSNSFCSQGTCRSYGTCATLIDCQNPSNRLNLPDCAGYLTCSGNKCTLACTDSACPPGVATTRCAESPCSIKTCSITGARCVSDFCGGCNAIFIDPAGNQVCSPQPDEGCQSDSDCSSNEFCSGGICRELGTCDTLLDCQNPSNQFEAPNCVGHLVCQNNQCTLNCTDSTCHPDVPVVRCFDLPCNVEICELTGVRCVNDVCGGCNAIFIDPAGNQVCKGGPLSTGNPPDGDPVKVSFKVP